MSTSDCDHSMNSSLSEDHELTGSPSRPGRLSSLGIKNSSDSEAHQPPSPHAQPAKGILKHTNARKRGSIVWNESNLDQNELDRIERGPRMKIDEPKTPYTHSRSLSSESDSGPSDFSLDGGVEDNSAQTTNPPSNEAKQEKQDGESQPASAASPLTQPPSTLNTQSPPPTTPNAKSSSSPPALSVTASLSSSPASSSTPSSQPVDNEASIDLHAAGDSLSPEKKHQIFEKKKHSNYANMGALLKKRPIEDDEDDE